MLEAGRSGCTGEGVIEYVMLAVVGWLVVAVCVVVVCFFFFQAEDGIRDVAVTGVQTCALPISGIMAQSFELADAAPWGQGEVRRGSLFVFNDFREKDFGSRGQAATGHLLCIAHQFVEVDLWSRNECADALAAFDDAFALERGERMACCHQAYLVNPCQVSFRSNYVPREQLPRLDALAEVALDPLVSRQTVSILRWHLLSRICRSAWAACHGTQTMRRTEVFPLDNHYLQLYSYCPFGYPSGQVCCFSAGEPIGM